MRFLAVHPGPLMYTKIFLRLEPLGLEIIAGAARRAGHEVRLIDLQVESHKAFFRLVRRWRPDVIAFSCNYLPNLPEIVDLAKAAKRALPGVYITVGGHSASFIAREFLEHGGGAVDCVLRGEAEAVIEPFLDAVEHDRAALTQVPGAVTAEGQGPPPVFVQNLDDLRPARDLVRKRNKYFIGLLDPAASIEFSRGCPWDCNFCSAWTFYGRSYRKVSPEAAVDELKRVREKGIFIVDDVAFIQSSHGVAIGEAIARAGLKKEYYLETRGDVLLRNKEVFRFWRDLGVKYMFLGLEAIDEEGLKKYRKRVNLGQNFEALDYARSLGLTVAINLIADPDWDEERFRVVREWAMEVPEVVNISVATPYPGTELWHTDGRRLITRDYRLFDIQHTVLPTRLPLERFYAELVKTQQVMNAKHLRWEAARKFLPLLAERLMRGQTNFFRMLWKFHEVYDDRLLLADHEMPVDYQIPEPPPEQEKIAPKMLYIHTARKRRPRQIDRDTERFVDATRMGGGG
ncbi:MAG: hopanoid C-3 methylase HpnR [Alphaproteobacteria bacterium]